MKEASSIPALHPPNPAPRLPLPLNWSTLIYCFTGLVHPGLTLGSMHPSFIQRTW